MKIKDIHYGADVKRSLNYQSASTSLHISASLDEDEDFDQAYQELKDMVDGLIETSIQEKLEQISQI